MVINKEIRPKLGVKAVFLATLFESRWNVVTHGQDDN